LTGVPAGETDAKGDYPAESINYRVAARVTELSELRKAFGRQLEKTPPVKKEPE
jgi:hypothetical protein